MGQQRFSVLLEVSGRKAQKVGRSRGASEHAHQPMEGLSSRCGRTMLHTADGVPIRTCRQDVESEAHAVAIAMLLPYPTVFNHINAGGEIEGIPAAVPVSAQARRHRVKVAGLWRLAPARARVRAASFAP
jgi:hypothetical protein